jgi:nucleotide-binding universal stress UspA family protein
VDQGHLAAFVDTAGKGQRFIEQTRTLPMFTNILLAVDGSAASLRAARHGIELAQALSARVTVLTVTTPWAAYFSRELAVVIPEVVSPLPAYDDKRETIAACILQNVVADARSARVEVRSLHRCNSDPYRAIIETAEREGSDLIVMGSHCERGFTGALLGSETMKVMTHTSTPVLVYRENE